SPAKVRQPPPFAALAPAPVPVPPLHATASSAAPSSRPRAGESGRLMPAGVPHRRAYFVPTVRARSRITGTTRGTWASLHDHLLAVCGGAADGASIGPPAGLDAGGLRGHPGGSRPVGQPAAASALGRRGGLNGYASRIRGPPCSSLLFWRLPSRSPRCRHSSSPPRLSLHRRVWRPFGSTRSTPR